MAGIRIIDEDDATGDLKESSDSLDDALARMVRPLGGALHPRLEWSLKVTRGQIRDRDRCLVWVDAPKWPGGDFTPVEHALAALGASPVVIAAQRRVAPYSRSQGIGLAQDADDVQVRCYLHYRPPGALSDHYDTLRLGRDGTVETARYRFTYLPEDPDGRRPEELVSPALRESVRVLCARERVRRLSGFWLRFRGAAIDQVCIALPWHPSLSSVLEALGPALNSLDVSPAALGGYADHGVRHVAFSTRARPLNLTLYFSAPAGRELPRTLAALKEQVWVEGQAARRQLERRFFAPLPTLADASERRAAHLDRFYSAESLGPWRTVLGPALHYHFGLFKDPACRDPDDAAMDAAAERAVTSLLPHVPRGGRVYDLGCGWGSAAEILARRHACRVVGLTLSRAQYRHCAALGLPVRWGDMEATLPPGHFDCFFMLESLSHVRDKRQLLQVLGVFGGCLVLRAHCQDGSPPSFNFGGTMHMVSSDDLRRLLAETGWRVRVWRNRRAESMPTLFGWARRFRALPPTRDQHLETFRRWCAHVAEHADAWATANPLVEVVADRG